MGGVFHLSQRFRPAGCQMRLHSPIGQHIFKDAPIGPIVIDDQHRQARQAFEF